MPELPEVETVVRQLAAAVPGHHISKVDVLHADLLAEPEESFRIALQNTRIESVTRRGKNLILSLSAPESRRCSLLVVNLGMTGQLLFFQGTPGEPYGEGRRAPSHPAIVFSLEPSSTLVYADVRRFGSLRIFSPHEWKIESARLGPEPLDPDLAPHHFHGSLSRSRSPIRSWLLDQKHLAGIGNIYAAEALFRAGIHPQRAARCLSRKEAERLLDSLRDVLSEAIEARGTTLRDYRTASGDLGGFGPALEAYGRDGEPCVRCNTPIQRVVFGNRSAFFCPECQKSP
ncbi:MAG: bifunctional DNA-formamidopyrimidine glycosylase/DNA-(apurinic or apyrimidinic site) lyase [Gemmatimonadota bacterium]|jgi:formamidopyrimidine-DNA glycosylase